jgi:SAM-dependent methyltransferase
MPNKTIDEATIKDFGDQWTRFPENIGWLASVDCLIDHFGGLIEVDALKGAYVADIGSGSGRIVNMLLGPGARKVAAIEPSDAFEVLKQGVADRADRVELIRAPGEAVGQLKDLDFVISLGVLHHVADPAPIVRAAFEALRPEGRIIVWLYGREGNETYLRFAEPLRRLTKRLPDRALSGIANLLNLALDVYIPLCRTLPLPMRSYVLNHLSKADRRMRRITVFDQLNPAYAKYYRGEEASALITEAGFEDVKLYHRHGYSWTVIGIKPAASSSLRQRPA